MSVDLSFSTAGEHFNVRSAAIIRHENHILCTTAEDLGFWFLPGGRPKRGESSIEGLKREFQEELNAEIEVDAPHIIAESFFDLKGEHYHELAFYYLAVCPAASAVCYWRRLSSSGGRGAALSLSLDRIIIKRATRNRSATAGAAQPFC